MICPQFSDHRNVLFNKLYTILTAPFHYEAIIFSGILEVLNLVHVFFSKLFCVNFYSSFTF
ncbi:hypothetical protein O3M35_009833 [Rhynocoris fuscipes]|uniref:Maturase K n=1 Tax=Rhynocoris fuscipes TaxID=488301 RepID=A0AAW1D546_9HEMI